MKSTDGNSDEGIPREGIPDMSHAQDRPSGRADDLTPEQRVCYEALVNSVDEKQFEVEFREILAHPESWVSADEALRRVQAIFAKNNGSKP